MAGLDFGLIKDKSNIQTADYRSAGSHQSENINYELVTDNSVWEEVVVVSATKTYYVSSIIFGGDAPAIMALGVGAAASEVVFLKGALDGSNPVVFNFLTPIKFSSGTRISAWSSSDSDVHFTLIGWEE